MTELPYNLDLNIGLVDVSDRLEMTPLPSSPAGNSLIPTTTGYSLQLRQVLYSPESQEQRLLASLHPTIGHPDIVRPAAFNAMLQEAIGWCEANARKRGRLPEKKRIRRASEVLAKLKSLTQTLRRFQHALHRG
ncbi:hypothetical protein AB1K70_03465 [Bremerella sp. JC770]|uniref:type III secretion apparatus assembly protein SctX n=1 Tax=Bremerella sp. JC770 TaxID=3232137 RepID=UPI003459E5B4